MIALKYLSISKFEVDKYYKRLEVMNLNLFHTSILIHVSYIYFN